jgi:hypothetical protein
MKAYIQDQKGSFSPPANFALLDFFLIFLSHFSAFHISPFHAIFQMTSDNDAP